MPSEARPTGVGHSGAVLSVDGSAVGSTRTHCTEVHNIINELSANKGPLSTPPPPLSPFG